MDYPTRINLGSGKDFKADFLNIDILPRWNPDIALDISGEVIGKTYDTSRFGPVQVRKEHFDLIIANDVLEHIHDLIPAMRNILDILKKGGEFHIYVPYELSLGACSDPTHVRAFNERSWIYWTEWAWYLGWEDRFDLKSLEYALSPLGNTMKDSGVQDTVIIRTPRAVDGMLVILTKPL